MSHVRLAETEQSRRGDAFGKSQKPRLHIRRELRDLGGHSFIQDVDAPSRILRYLICEILAAPRAIGISPIRTRAGAFSVDEQRGPGLLLGTKKFCQR
ncbi:MAG: hypothetical protein WA177_13260 [Xanthobacteraceae bacterium]